MKLKIKQTTATMAAALLTLAGCQREAIGPEVSAIEEGTEVIPVWVEGMPDTKMTVNSTTGICAWSFNDLIALCIDDAGDNTYKNYPVVDGSVRLSLASSQSRANYAIYPTTAAPASGYATPTVMYPTTYNMALIPEANYADWCPAPMVAVNSGAALKFYHVGALVKVTISYVPAGTKTIELTFNGMNVTGNFSVTNTPGSATAKATTAAGSTNSTVTFTNLNISGSTVTLNVPIPLGDYSSLTAISANMKDSDGTSLFSVTNPVYGWGTIAHGQGKKVTIESVVITHLSGYDGRFRTFFLSPGILKWDSSLNNGLGAYTLTEGNDPLELLRYYGQDSSLGVYYHQYNDGSDDSNPTTLRFRLDGVNNPADALSNTRIYVEGLEWIIPSSGDWSSIITTGTSGSTINSVGSAKFVNVLVNLDTATDVDGNDYHNMGTSHYEGNTLTSSTGESYQAGVLLIPDNVSITCPDITANSKNYRANIINWNTLKVLLDGGCAFLPSAGYHRGSWDRAGIYGYYWTSTFSKNGYANHLYFDTSTTTMTYLAMEAYYPVKLVR